MSRVDQINSLLREKLANLANKEVFLEHGLITISYVQCSPDLRHAKVGVSVLPENLSGTALKKLRRSSKALSSHLKKMLKLKYTPKLNWSIDKQERQAADIDQVIKQAKNSSDYF